MAKIKIKIQKEAGSKGRPQKYTTAEKRHSAIKASKRKWWMKNYGKPHSDEDFSFFQRQLHEAMEKLKSLECDIVKIKWKLWEGK
jgi:5-bromo-4-chloroindolyl phosphate hydrolysis protein